MRGKPKNDEHRIQSACVRWFRLKYPKLKNVLLLFPMVADVMPSPERD